MKIHEIPLNEDDGLFEVVIEFEGQQKRLYTVAKSEEEAGARFHRHIVCQWVGGLWDGPETLLEGTFDQLENGAMI